MNLFHIHKWTYIYKEGSKQVPRCEECGRYESTMYDMTYRYTYWIEGDLWSNLKNFAIR